MTPSAMVEALIGRLIEAGYTQLKTPFRVASVEFEFTAALIGSGPRALDLVIIIDAATGSFGDTDGSNVRNRVETLSRALDITHSRYTLSAVIAGAALTKDMEILTETCRVLTVPALVIGADGRPSTPEMVEEMDDQIRLLLPFDLRSEEVAPGETSLDAIGVLLSELSDEVDSVLLQSLIIASLVGDKAVTKALGRRLDEVLGELETDQ
jgi:hypothetical protein